MSDVCTRSLLKLKSPIPDPKDIDFVHVSTQTDEIPYVHFDRPVRLENEKTGIYHTVDPDYLKCMALIMSENLSASEAIKVVHIMFTVIYKQIRHLPLRLEKNYVKAVQRLRKLGGSEDDNHEHAFHSEIENQMQEFETVTDGVSNDEGVKSSEIDHLKKTSIPGKMI